ncbi:uncharacterized protein [Temnothorax nylanderi]|uniref:uncharacterized protein isoform X2 n=1 Tax=Temnothorax nylanderi TaxID=102681 RepID=UPI003A8A94E3
MDAFNFDDEIQKLLLKKEKEYGQLKFISSRATEETSCFIDNLLEDVADIAKKCNMYNVKIFVEDDSFKPCDVPRSIIISYNHFVLNTNFSSQYLLAEDMLLGHIVNFWPSLSPYLFIQVIWHLKCEDLLIESLMHLPLDVCVEILEITIRCINELEILRERRFVFLLISKLYYKCMWLHVGTLSKRDVEELACQLVTHFQALLEVASSKFILPKSSNQEKYVQHGILLKYVIRCIKMCMRYKTKDFQENGQFVQPFKITYGNPDGCTDFFCQLPLDKRAIIIECRCFMEFMKRDEFLLTNEHLLHCLQQLIGSSQSEESALTLQELCDCITNGKLDEEIGMKKLIRRYKEWDLTVFNFISRKTKALNEEDIGILFEYLHYVFAHTHTYKEKHEAYILVLKVLLQERLSTMYRLVLQYTLRHFHDNRLEYLFDSENFKKFIESNINMHDQDKLRIILIFVMLNPKEVLTTLVRATMGSTETKYRNVMFKRPQLAYLHTFLTLKLDNQNNLLTYLLNDAWQHDHSTWCYKQFEAFMNDMLENEAITADDLLNNVYTPCLTSAIFNYTNLLSVLIHMYSILRKKICTHNTNYVLLIVQLTKKMSMIRKCSPRYLRNTVNNLLDYGTMILNFLFITLNLPLDNQNEIMFVNNFVEPIDQVLLVPKLQTMLRGTVRDVIQNYERRCYATYQFLRANPQFCEPNIRDYVHSFQFDQRPLLRHMMLHATEKEYMTFAIEMTIASCAYFGWANELMAYENVLHITTEAMQLALVFTDTFPRDTFVSLLRALVQYCDLFSRLKYRRRQREPICNILSKTLFSLKSIVRETQYGKIYDNLFECISMSDESNFKVEKYFNNISELIEVYFAQSEEIEGICDRRYCKHYSSLIEEKVPAMYNSYLFICECLKLSNTETHYYPERLLRSL